MEGIWEGRDKRMDKLTIEGRKENRKEERKEWTIEEGEVELVN